MTAFTFVSRMLAARALGVAAHGAVAQAGCDAFPFGDGFALYLQTAEDADNSTRTHRARLAAVPDAVRLS